VLLVIAERRGARREIAWQMGGAMMRLMIRGGKGAIGPKRALRPAAFCATLCPRPSPPPQVVDRAMAQSSSFPSVLFFIPDFFLYTTSVTETEISHSQHIISELLELLVDSNEIGLEVSEFEGDAVLFYCTTPPTLDKLLAQAKKMFLNFHLHLKEREKGRVCECGACARMHLLTLKFIAHCGPANTMAVKGHSKFIGKSVIVAHRLLKNPVPEAEYLLVTQETLDRLDDRQSPTVAFESGSCRYDEIGEVPYRHHSMACYLDELQA